MSDHGRLVKVTHTWLRLHAEQREEIGRLKSDLDRATGELEVLRQATDLLSAGATINWNRYKDERDNTEALSGEVVRLRGALQACSEAVFEAIQSLEEWGAAEELAPGIARWRAAARAAVSAGKDIDE